MLTKKQLKVAEKIFDKKEEFNSLMDVKNFILNHCIALDCDKETLLSEVKHENAKELLNEFVFDFSAPWLYFQDCCYISKADYDRLDKNSFIDPVWQTVAQIAKAAIDNHEQLSLDIIHELLS